MKQQSEHAQQSETNRWLRKFNEIEKEKFKKMKQHNAVMEKKFIDILESKKI